MNNIYVDELPKSCEECDFCEHFEKDAHGKGEHEVACYFNGFLTNALLGDTINAKHCSLLKPLTDRLAEERKKVVSEIRTKFKENLIDWYKDEDNTNKELYIDADELWRILDQIERGE